jgi:octaprenyl-diphosphate synthase
LALITEYIHMASLFHDDVIDESKLRRGKETANLVWGNKASVLVGDYLYTLHIQLLLSLKNFVLFELMNQVTQRIGNGELEQLSNRHRHDLGLNDYLKVIEAKTSMLFAAATSGAGHISNMPQAIIDDLYHYGLHLGNAFQLIDDALDYSGEAGITGKNIGDDLAEGKPTLPLIYAMRNGTAEEAALVRRAVSSGGLAELDDVMAAIRGSGALDYTRRQAEAEADTARAALSVIPDSQYRDSLIQLASFAVTRSH